MAGHTTNLLAAKPEQKGCVYNNSVVMVAVMDQMTPLQRAVAAPPFDGNQSRFAAAIGTSQQNVSNWCRKGSPLPAEYVLKAEEVTGISRHEWRPDVFAPAPESAAA